MARPVWRKVTGAARGAVLVTFVAAACSGDDLAYDPDAVERIPYPAGNDSLVELITPVGEHDEDATVGGWSQVLLDETGRDLTIFFDSGPSGTACGIPVDVETVATTVDVTITVWMRSRSGEACDVGGTRAVRVGLGEPIATRTLRNGACDDDLPAEERCGGLDDVPGELLTVTGSVSYLDVP
jgi:hypothetical protein